MITNLNTMRGFTNDEMASIFPFHKMYERYKLTPSIVFGKSLRTQQFTVNATPQLIIQSVEPRMYMVGALDASNPVFIGGREVATVSGFPIVPALSPIVFAMTENSELWAVAASDELLFLIDMGI